MAQVTPLIDQMQTAMAQQLSRAETPKVFDDLTALGLLTPAMHSEAPDCIALAPPSAQQPLGQTGALFKNELIPQMVEQRGQLAAQPPDQRIRNGAGAAPSVARRPQGFQRRTGSARRHKWASPGFTV
jgi:hypothetical protein